MTELFTTMMEGNIIEAILGAYTGIMGVWFIVIILLLGFSMIYIKTQNAGTLAVLGILLSMVLLPIIPDRFISFVWIAMALCAMAILWKSFS
jgi:hypothetical protein